MSSERWIVIPKWDEFQHRDMARSSVPPWIKAYTKLLSDDDFLALSHHLRGVLLGIWLEYARSTRQLSGSTSALSRRLGQRITTRDLTSLNHAGFIAFSASRLASKVASTLASLEVEVEKNPPTPHASRKNGRSPRQRGTNPRAQPVPRYVCGIDGCTGSYPTERELADHRELAHPPVAVTAGTSDDQPMTEPEPGDLQDFDW